MDSLTLYIYPSPFGVNWKSPRHLAQSVILNAASMRSRMIGHVSVELQGERNGRSERFFTGMSSHNDALNRRLIFREKLGLGILFYEYEGFLESPEQLDPEKDARLARGNFSFIRFRLSKESFEKARLYLHEYRERNVARAYGLPQRPRYGEGAGCSAFGASFLEVAGLMQDEFRKHWSLDIRVPEAFLKNIAIWRLLVPNASNSKWAEAHEPGRNVFFWDPDLMHAWVKKQVSESPASTDFMSVIREKNTWGVLFDSSKIVPTDVQIWLR
jgi:hypothetical protein